jgi:hypothetical protein
VASKPIGGHMRGRRAWLRRRPDGDPEKTPHSASHFVALQRKYRIAAFQDQIAHNFVIFEQYLLIIGYCSKNTPILFSFSKLAIPP